MSTTQPPISQLSKIVQLSQVLGEQLLHLGWTVTSAESCTGGGISQAITDIPGSSGWFNQSWVTYSNAAKHQQLGVRETTLQTHGAVSSEVVHQMAEGAASRAQAELALAVSGVAGPTGGTPDKPVGTVWFGCFCHGDTTTEVQCFSGDRAAVREQAVLHALQLGLSKIRQYG